MAFGTRGELHCQHHQKYNGSTKRGIIVQARTASPGTWRAFNLVLNGDVRCGSKPARRQRIVFFNKERIRHGIPNGPAHRNSLQIYTPTGSPMSPLVYGCTIPRKSARPQNTRNSWQHFEHLRASTGAGRYKEKALHQARMGTSRPRVQRRIIRM